jgi:O-antigen/teichoic acid export membrane protein
MITKVFKNSAIYSVKVVFDNVIGLFLIPVYTFYLIPEEYGIVSLMSLLSSILLIFYTVGQPNAVMRLYFDYQSSELQSYISIVVIYLLLVPLFLGLLLIAFGSQFFHVFFKDIPFFPYGFLAILIAYFTCTSEILLALWRAKEMPIKYILFSAAVFSITTICALFFVIKMKWGAYGKLLGTAIAAGCFWLFAVILLYKPIHIKTALVKLKKSFFFGLPLIPHLLATTILAISDRYILGRYTNLNQVGIYSLGYTLGTVVCFASAGFGQAWGPFFYSKIGERDAPPLFSRIATYYFFFVMMVTMILVLFSREIIMVLASPSYRAAHIVMPIVALGNLFNCLYCIPIYTLYSQKKTVLIPVITGIAALINIFLNFMLIPYFGMIGAAWATVVSYFIMFVLVLVISQKMYFIPYEIKRLALITAVIFSIIIFNAFILKTIAGNISISNVLVKVTSIVVILSLLCFAEYFEIKKNKTKILNL